MKAKYVRQRKRRAAVRPVIEGLEPRTLLTAYVLDTLASFNSINGANPSTSMVLDSSGDLFGTTVNGGASGFGIVFEIAQGTTSITTLATFNGANGSGPEGGLTIDSNGNLFGTTISGGLYTEGTVFEIAQGTTSITSLASFNDNVNGYSPYAPVTLDSSGDIFGTTESGGPSEGSPAVGTVFEIPHGTSAIDTLAVFNNTNGSTPVGAVTLDSSGDLFGTTGGGGTNGDGTVFEIAQSTSSLSTLANFNITNGQNPGGALTLDPTGDLFGTTYAGGGSSDGTVFEIPHGTSSILTLVTFNGANGQIPEAAVTLDSSGNLFGTATDGGASSDGIVFELPQGAVSITALATFNSTNGAFPDGDLTLDSSGNLFGATGNGGTSNDGTIFELSPSTKLGFAVQPATTAAGAVITPAVTVNVQDASGALETADSSAVTLSIASGPAGAMLGGSVTANAVNGVATFSNLSLTKAGAYTLTATDGTLTAATSASFNITPGAAARLALTAVPSGADVNANISPAVTVTVQDSDGNTVSTDSSAVTLSIATGPTGAMLGGTVTANAVNGVATFSNLSLNEVGAYTLTASDGALAPAASASISVTQGVAAELAFTVVPPTAVAGAVISPAVTVTVEDSNGVLVPTDASAVTLAIASGPAGAVLGGTLTESAINGVATFSDLSLSLPGTYTLQSTDGILTAATSVAITVFPAAKIGGLDPTFGFGGEWAHNVGLTSTAGVVALSDGKSIIAGTGGSTGAEVFGISRYNVNGSLDTTFGTNGITNTAFAGSAQAAAVVLLADGDILVAGTVTTLVSGQSTGSQFALAEYTSAGVLDTTFGNGAGYVLASFSSTAGTLSNDVAHALAVGPGGAIYVGGSSDAGGSGLEFAVAAFAPSGSPLPTFGTNGKVLLDFAGDDASIAALAPAADGDLVATGSAVPSSGVSSVALAEFLPTGALNPKFGVKGKLTTSVGSVDDAATALAIDAKGNIVVGGYTGIGSVSAGTLSANFLLLRFAPTAKLDKTFGSGGIVTTSFNQPAAISTVLILSDGTIVASGKTAASLAALDASDLGVAVARYTNRGQPDTFFNGTGQAIINLNSAAVPQSLSSLQADSEQTGLLRSLSTIPFDATSALMTAFMQLTQSDQGTIATTSGGDLLDVGNSGTSTVEAAIVATGLDLSATLAASLPQSVIGGAKGTASVNVTELGTQLAQGTYAVELFASSGPFLPAGQAPFQSIPEKLKLKEGAAASLHLKFQYPSSLSKGNYYLVATVATGTIPDLNPAQLTSASRATVLIAPPFVLLAGSALTAPVFSDDKAATVSFTIMNTGNAPASAKSAVQFFASTGDTLSGATSLGTVPLQLNLKPGASHPYKVKLALPSTLPAGTYTLLALLDPANVFNDPNAATNFIVSGNMFTVA